MAPPTAKFDHPLHPLELDSSSGSDIYRISAAPLVIASGSQGAIVLHDRLTDTATTPSARRVGDNDQLVAHIAIVKLASVAATLPEVGAPTVRDDFTLIDPVTSEPDLKVGLLPAGGAVTFFPAASVNPFGPTGGAFGGFPSYEQDVPLTPGSTSVIAAQVVEVNDQGVVRMHIAPTSRWQDVTSYSIVVANNTGVPVAVVLTVDTADSEASDVNTVPSSLQKAWIVSKVTTAFPAEIAGGATASGTVKFANCGPGPFRITSSIGLFNPPQMTVSAPQLLPASGGGSPTAITDADPIATGRMVQATVQFVAPSVGVADVSSELTIDQAHAGYTGLPALETPHNNKVTFAVRYANASHVMMLLDTSGSMSWLPSGMPISWPSTTTEPAGWEDTRWGQLHSAALVFSNLVRNPANAQRVRTISIRCFPHPTTSAMHGELLAPVEPSADAAFDTTFRNALRVRPIGGTPMGEGIDSALNVMTSGSMGDQTHRRVMVMMSDGDTNMGRAIEVVDGSNVDNNRFKAANIVPMTLAFGPSGSAPAANLSAIVSRFNAKDAGARGVYRAALTAVDHDPIPSTITKEFANTAASLLGLNAVTDPLARVTDSAPRNVHTFTVSELDSSVTILVDWAKAQDRRLTVQLITPRCELITLRDFKQDKQLWSAEAPRHVLYSISDAYLRGGSDDGEGRYGVWRLIVSLKDTDGGYGGYGGYGGDDVDGGYGGYGGEPEDSEYYRYTVFADSHMRMTLDGIPATCGTGDEMRPVVRLRASVERPSVTLQVTAPSASLARYLVSALVSADTLAEVKKELESQGEVDFWTIYAAALRREGKTFDAATHSVRMPLSESSPGVYEADKLKFAVPGAYDFYAIVEGEAKPGVTFRRDASAHLSVIAKADGKGTVVEVQGPPARQDTVVIVRPADAYGNPILFDPRFSNAVTLSITGGTPSGTLQPQPDGSYTQVVTVQPGVVPSVDVIADGKVITTRTLPVVTANLVWVDTVGAYEAGNSVDANKHKDPKAVLGAPSSDFLSLGSYGSVVVAARCLARRAKEVCVFIAPEAHGRAYQVEVAEASPRTLLSQFGKLDDLKFREIGRGRGTQSFDLGALSENAVPVIRLLDLSGLSGGSRKPLAAPGASFVAVGFRLAPEMPPVYDITLDKLTVCGTEHITLGSRCKLVGANGKPGILSNSGLASTIVGPSCQLGTLFSESHIVMGPACTVDGDVHTEGRFIQQGSRVTGKVHEGEALRLPILRVFSDVPLPTPSQADLLVTTRGLKRDPGQVGDVRIKSGGRLVLSAGRYFFESLVIDEQGELDVSDAKGVVEVYVRGSVSYRGRIITQKDKANLVLVVLGKEGALLGAAFRGTIVAPNGKLLIDVDEKSAHVKHNCSRDGVQHVGAFYGKQVIVEAGSTLIHLPA